MSVSVGVDTGGTFTDFVVAQGESVWAFKLPSTPEEPERAVLLGLQRIEEARSKDGVLEIVHGTTVATNTVLERKGAKTAFLTTQGFEDLLEIGRQNRRDLYRLGPSKPKPLVPREWRWGIEERVLADGSVEKRVDLEELRRVVQELKRAGIESVAVCYLFSFRDPGNEIATGRVLSEAGFPVSLSCEVLPEFREYERASATVFNAYLALRVAGYLERLRSGIAKVIPEKESAKLWLMQSNGGWVAPELAARFPVRTVLSGPAGGVYGGWTIAREAGLSRVITLDIGGTSADVSLVDGEILRTREATIDDLPLPLPVVDVHTVGAGGGSLAWLDLGGALRVGPQSAGADPGPLCYGKGTEPTVTDAHVVLGRLDPSCLLSSSGSVNPDRSWEGLARLCERIQPSADRRQILDVAQGIIEIANAHMARAIRSVSLARGWDPRDFVLVAFGGAGGLHACDLAEAFGIRNVLVPLRPGLVSAWGALCAEAVRDASQSVLVPAEEGGEEGLEGVFQKLEQALTNELCGEGFSKESLRFGRAAELRYRGQSYELALPWEPQIQERFHRAHQKRYGYAHRGWPVEIVTLHVTAVVPRPKPRALAPEPEAQAAVPIRQCYFQKKLWETPYYPRGMLRPGDALEGPAVVTEYGATTVVPPGWAGRVDSQGNLQLSRKN